MPPEAVPTSPAAVLPPSKQAEGLRGIQVSDSSICIVDGVNGRLLYRGYNIPDLAEHSSFEETAYLLLQGELPTPPQLKQFTKALQAERQLPAPVAAWLKKTPRGTDPMDALRTAVSMMGLHDPDVGLNDVAARHRIAIRLIARVATIVATIARVQANQAIVRPSKTGGHAANFMRMLTGKEPDDFSARAMDIALILHADHEFNASTFSARVTASTLSDPYSAITSAVGTLKGPLHGGANLAVFKHLKDIGSVDRVERWVAERLSRHEKVFGFGHAVYKTMDPRATVLKKWSEQAGQRFHDARWFQISTRLQDVVYQQKAIWPNVDFYTASLYHVLGIPEAHFPPIFAVSRISGWMAHAIEQYDNNKLIRPLSHYVGPSLRPYVPLARRA